MAEGIDTRHQRTCRSRQGGRCNCAPAFQAHVFDKRTGKRIRKTFPTPAAAKAWRQDALVALRHGTYRAPAVTTVTEALSGLLDGMRDGRVLDRSGNRYKAATCRSYAQAVSRYLEPALGHRRLTDVHRRDVQAFVDALRAQGLSASTIHNKLDPLRVLYRRALRDELVNVDPTEGLELPAVRGRRERIAGPERAQALIDAAPVQDRALWACLFFAGLRRGEARALRWEHVDFDAGVIRVRRGWDDVEGDQDVKTAAGRRNVPLAGVLRRELAAHKLRTGHGDGDLVFGRSPTLPFTPSTVRRRAREAWGWTWVENPERQGPAKVWVKAREDALEPLTPHEARHSFASYLVASGVNLKQLSVYVGHTDVRTTLNVYAHLLPDDLDTARAALDALLEPPGAALLSRNASHTGG